MNASCHTYDILALEWAQVVLEYTHVNTACHTHEAYHPSEYQSHEASHTYRGGMSHTRMSQLIDITLPNILCMGWLRLVGSIKL